MPSLECGLPKDPAVSMPAAGRCSAAPLWPEREWLVLEALGHTGHTLRHLMYSLGSQVQSLVSRQKLNESHHATNG